MKVSFIAHYYHGEKTKSHEFFVREVLAGADVTVYFDEEYRDEVAVDAVRLDLEQVTQADRIVVWQSERVLDALLAFGTDPARIVFVPMHDSAVHWDRAFVERIAGVRTICFSRSLHADLCRDVRERVYAMYMPEPATVPGDGGARDGLGIYCWIRRPESLLHLKQLLERCPRALKPHVTLKFDTDPGVEVRSEDLAFLADHPVREDVWQPTKADYLRSLAAHDLFVAPRAVEGIGLSFLDAMAAGVVCVGPDSATFTDYVQHNVSGFVLGPEDDPGGKAAFGALPRIRAYLGRMVREKRREWVCHHVPRLRAFIDGTAAEGREGGEGAAAASLPEPAPVEPGAASGPVELSIVMATYNCRDELSRTLQTLRGADLRGVEIVFSDGGSTDGTLELAQSWGACRSTVRSGADRGPYDAMRLGAERASARYVWFLNAGDLLFDEGSLAAALAAVREADADLYYFDYVYRDARRADHHKSPMPFERTVRQLESGRIDYRWREGIPCHQGTIVRRSTLLRVGFDDAYRIAADHDQYFRLWRAGARFRKVPVTLAVYVGGGMSARNEYRCVDEWWTLAQRHSRRPDDVHRFYLKDTLGVVRALDPGLLPESVRRRVAECMDGGWYDARNPEARDALQSPVEHFLHAGWRSGRAPSPFFSSRDYGGELARSIGVDESSLQDVNLFLHWVLYGHRLYCASSFHHAYCQLLDGTTHRMSTYRDLVRTLASGVDAAARPTAAAPLADGNCAEAGSDAGARRVLATLLAMNGRTFLAAAYRHLLGRAPDDAGVSAYLAELDAGRGKLEILRSLADSSEARARGAAIAAFRAAIDAAQAPEPADEVPIDALLALEGERFVEAAYLRVLGRRPDDEGRRNYAGRLEAGEARADVLCALYASDEARRRGRAIADLDRLVALRQAARADRERDAAAGATA